MDLITRKFTVDRGGKMMEYPFTTYPVIFKKRDNHVENALCLYLADVFQHGVPPDLAQSVSAMPPIVCKTKKVVTDLIDYARRADYQGRGNQQHECVQKFLLANDPHTLAIEVPVWDDASLGHIDVLRIFEDKIVVADFKPNAHLETKAASQVLRYIVMLSKLLELPLRFFDGVYFDDKNAYLLDI